MKKTVFGCLGAAAVVLALQFTPASVQAAGLFGSCLPCDQVGQCDPCGPCGDDDSCNPCDAIGCGVKASGLFLNGHIDSGFFANGHGQRSTYTGAGSIWTGRGADYDSGNTDLLQNTRLTGAQINQTYLSLGKAVDGRRGLDIGGTVDFTWGADAYIVQSKGLEYAAGHGGGADGGRWGTGDYYAAFAQAYVELEYGRWNTKIGKFYAPFGSTSYKSTDNFFYSWASTNIIAPTTGSGAYTTYKVSDSLSVIGGWVMPEEFGETSEHNDVLGGIIWNPTKRVNVLYAFAAGTDKSKYSLPVDVDEFVQSVVVTTQISKRLKYVFDWTLLNQSAKGSIHGGGYGLNNEVIYQYNKKWAFGSRFGMLSPCGAGMYIGSLSVPGDPEWYTVGVGANWTPNKWLIVKPEVRYDWIKDATYTPFNLGENSYQVSGGVSAVVKF